VEQGKVERPRASKMWALGLLLLFAIAISIRYVGKKLAPVVMPSSRLKAVAACLIGGFIGSLIFQLCHLWDWALVAEINLIGAILGAVVSLFLVGIYPFIKIFLGKI
jgi:uncharacterized membrane protein YeaQ/YmgE (transglycosylase-associated protein family)